MNSRAKGARGERRWRDELRANGYRARRGQQFSGSPDSPDVVCEDLAWAHFEVKAVEKLNIYDAIEQALHDCGRKVPFVCHCRNFRPWLVTMPAEVFFQFLRGVLPPERTCGPDDQPASGEPKQTKNSKTPNENQIEQFEFRGLS